TSPPSAETPTEAAVGESQAVEEFALRFVLDWLQASRGQESRLAAYGLHIPRLQVPEQPYQVAHPAVAAAQESAPGLWSVTVGVTVTEPTDPPEVASEPATEHPTGPVGE